MEGEQEASGCSPTSHSCCAAIVGNRTACTPTSWVLAALDNYKWKLTHKPSSTERRMMATSF